MSRKLNVLFGMGLCLLTCAGAWGEDFATTPGEGHAIAESGDSLPVNDNDTFTIRGDDSNGGNVAIASLGVMEVASGASLHNTSEGTITNAGTFSNAGEIRNAGTIANTGNIIFENNSTYNVEGTGSIDNSAGSIKAAGTMTGLDKVFTSLVANSNTNIGKVTVDGGVKIGVVLDANSATAGEVTLNAGSGDSYNVIDIGAADLVINAPPALFVMKALPAPTETGVVFKDDVTAGTLTINTISTFNENITASSGDITFNTDATLKGAATAAAGAFNVLNGSTVVLARPGDGTANITTGAFIVDENSTFVYSTAGGNQTAVIAADAHEIAGNLAIAAGHTLAFKNQAESALNTITFDSGSSLTLEARAKLDVSGVDGTGTGTVALNLEGGIGEWVGKTEDEIFGLSSDSINWNIFDLGRFVNNSGSIGLQRSNIVLAPLMNTRNMSAAGTAMDNMLNSMTPAELLAGNIDEIYDEIYRNTQPGGDYGTARRMLGANFGGEHAVYAREGIHAAHDAFWNGISLRRNVNLDLSLDVAGVSRRRAGSDSAYGDLVPPNCYPARSRGRTVRDANGGYSYWGGNSTVWADYIGSWAKRNGRDGIDGFRTNTNGLIIGYEYALGQFTFGAAGSYARTHTTMSDYGMNNKTDALNLGLYADYNHSSGFFGRAGLGLSYGWNEYSARTSGVHRTGNFDNLVWNLYGEVGYAVRTRVVNIIPSLGLRFSQLHQDGWTDKNKAALGRDNDIGSSREYAMDIPLEVRVNKTFAVGGIMVAPEVKAGITYATKKNRAKLNSGIAAMYGASPGRTTGNIGLGAKAKFGSNVDAGLDYAFEFGLGQRFRQHSLAANIGVSF